MDGILVYKDDAWCIMDKNGNKEPIDPDKTIELEMEGHWVQSHLTIREDRILIDNEAELNAAIANEVKIRMRQY